MLKGIIILCCLCALTARAQKLTGGVGSRVINFEVKIDIAEEGSYELQRANTLGGWTTITNYKALPGLLTHVDKFDASQKFFRVKRENIPPAITVHPVPMTKYSGQAFKLEAAATGSWPLHLQWYKISGTDAVPISGATTNYLNFTGKVSETGSYAMLVTNKWNSSPVFSATVQVQVIAPVATSISGKLIHFDIQGGRAPLATSGNYEMNVQTTGAFTTQGSSVFLNDAGYWAYTKWDEVTGYIQTQASFIYGNGLYRLTFEEPGAGTFLLTVPGSAGQQFGRFNFLN